MTSGSSLPSPTQMSHNILMTVELTSWTTCCFTFFCQSQDAIMHMYIRSQAEHIDCCLSTLVYYYVPVPLICCSSYSRPADGELLPSIFLGTKTQHWANAFISRRLKCVISGLSAIPFFNTLPTQASFLLLCASHWTCKTRRVRHRRGLEKKKKKKKS